MRGIFVVALVISVIGLASPTSASIITNGSFESPNIAFGNTQALFYAGDTSIIGWTITGPASEHVRVLDLNTTPGSNYYTPYGDQWLELGGRDNHMTIYQDVFGLTHGSTYSLTFNLASEYIFDDSATVSVADLTGVNTQVFTASANPADAAWREWNSFTYTFVLFGTSARISFKGGDGTSNYSGYDVGLDNVALNRVEATVPEPASLAIWGGIALAGVVAGWRRKRSQRVTA